MSMAEMEHETEHLLSGETDRQEHLSEAVKIKLMKLAGMEGYFRQIEASDPAAAVNGLAVLTQEVAKFTNTPVSDVLVILAAALMPTVQAEAREREKEG